MKATEQFTAIIKNYLDERSKTDELFRQSYTKKNKTLKECISYILGEVSAIGCNGYSDEEIFSMAVHYYDEDDIKVKPNRVRSVVTNQTTLTEAEKTEAKEQAMEKYRNQCIEDIKRKEREKQKAIAAKKKQIDNSQLSLF